MAARPTWTGAEVRVVAGSAGGRHIAVPSGTGTRPTSDRVREAVFGRLDAWGVVEGARVLDLYAGSGALGLEALSRGAAGGVAVEADRVAHRVGERNAVTLGLGLVVVRDRVERWLAGATDRFDLVLLDPPYDLAPETLAAVLALVAPLLAPGAVVVVERSGRSPAPLWPSGLELIDSRSYGETTVWFAETPEPEAPVVR